MLLLHSNKFQKMILMIKKKELEDVPIKSKENIFVKLLDVKNHMELKVPWHNIWNLSILKFNMSSILIKSTSKKIKINTKMKKVLKIDLFWFFLVFYTKYLYKYYLIQSAQMHTENDKMKIVDSMIERLAKITNRES